MDLFDTPLEIIDIGLNLAHPRFDADRHAMIDRARQAGVVGAVLTGTSVPGSAEVLRLAEGLRPAEGLPGWARATVGVHPHEASTLNDAALAELAALADSPLCAAIGECGLDFERDLSPRPDQQRAFEAQLDLAARLGLPVFLHQRGAMPRFAEILAEWRPRLVGAVVHCFTDGPEVARELLDLDCELGITGWVCDERRAGPLRDSLRVVPMQRLMIETDAPYLPPRDLRLPSPVPGIGLSRLKSRNEPALLPWILRAVADAGGWQAWDLAESSTQLARERFGLEPQASPKSRSKA